MALTDATLLLRPGLLDGVTILIAQAPGGPAAGSPGDECARAAARLGASVLGCELEAGAEEQRVAEILAPALGAGRPIDVLIVDCSSAARAAGGGAIPGADALAACTDATWAIVQAVADACFIETGRGGRIMLIAPPAGGLLADAAVAALENLARTLSIEWARRSVSTVAIAPGRRTAPCDIAAVTAYLASAAGSFFSGCLMDLRGPEVAQV